jgi:mono/diheme cytochrome c family protein
MRMQPRYESYRSSAFFADGKAMRLAPAGTRSIEGGAVSGWQRPRVTPAVIERGRAQFHIYCAVCHGECGDGVSIVASNMEPPKPPSLIVPPAALMPDSVIAAVIANGLATMPSFATEMTVADRIAVTEYVKQLQHPAVGGATDGAVVHGGVRQ